ncbi:MAG: nicotinate (nicotinamide) nucleotide adenylyltransferase [Clostridia bacterium]|nr:nicotinate (nicotinamide) nucleotide adenylyltransferase [Clostridia bacterium]
MLRVGIYGGTFSPVHAGHVAAAKAFMEQMWLDVLYVIPTGNTPHKQMDGEVTSAQRLRMCELAFADVEGVIVSDMEMRREGKSFTVDTLEALAGEDRRLFLLLGTDMMLTLGSWRAPERIFELCYPVYVRRESDKALDEQIVQKIAEYNQKYGKVVRRIVTDPIEVSSTEIRTAIRAGQGIEHLVPARVAAYMKENGLYQ